MELMLAIVLGDNEKVPAGSTVQAHIQGNTVVLPIDKECTVAEVITYMNTISPSLDAKHIVKLKDGNFAVVVEVAE